MPHSVERNFNRLNFNSLKLNSSNIVCHQNDFRSVTKHQPLPPTRQASCKFFEFFSPKEKLFFLVFFYIYLLTEIKYFSINLNVHKERSNSCVLFPLDESTHEFQFEIAAMSRSVLLGMTMVRRLNVFDQNHQNLSYNFPYKLNQWLSYLLLSFRSSLEVCYHYPHEFW